MPIDNVKLPPLDEECIGLERTRNPLTCRERQLRETLSTLSATRRELEQAKADLAAMTEDRNLWQGDHNEDCPNLAILKARESPEDAWRRGQVQMRDYLADNFDSITEFAYTSGSFKYCPLVPYAPPTAEEGDK